MAECCGSFIYQRTMKEVWPNLIKILERQCKISMGKEDNSPYRFTIGYKLQMKLLTELGNLSLKLNIFEKDLRLVFAALQPYLSFKQPKSLREATINTFKLLTKVNADAVWLFLNNLCSPQPELSPLHSSFCPIHFAEPKKEYSQSVYQLLQEIS
ncbi:TELO2-interacting protein 1 homolog [Centruroides sculpturatus]|uniref:TELO2-interacting protein 1 homolog n=1 Tax=Centruroides sculpturatus TaxID=218467 RepID=UPI000C6D0604|nr:TELO2-interacting protein 1 homolog [Centruroides sculpturatus]